MKYKSEVAGTPSGTTGDSVQAGAEWKWFTSAASPIVIGEEDPRPAGEVAMHPCSHFRGQEKKHRGKIQIY